MIGQEGLEDRDFVGDGWRNFLFLLRLSGRLLGAGRGGTREYTGECQAADAFQAAGGMVVGLHWRAKHIDVTEVHAVSRGLKDS